MSATATYEPHPLAALIPSMTNEEYTRLMEDVAANGLLDAIVLHEGKVLDGRHRLRACEDTATEPSFVNYDGDSPAQFVLSHNLHRRHLSVSQRAAVALDFLPHLETEAKGRQGTRTDLTSSPNGEKVVAGRLASEEAGELAGASSRLVQRAKRVQEQAPDLMPQVREGALTLDAADSEVKRRKAGIAPHGNGRVTMRSIQRIASQAAALAMAIDAVNLTKSCARLSDDERAESLQDCKTGLKALNALANALGR